MDSQLQFLKRKAYGEPDNIEALWPYVRSLERSCGSVETQPTDMVIPFRWYRRVSGDRAIFDQPESLDGMSFLVFPYRGPVANSEEFVALYSEELEDYDNPIISGYGIVDKAFIEMLDNVRYSAGGDSASDAISAYMTAFALAQSHTMIHWNYYLHDYDDRSNNGYKPWEEFQPPDPSDW